MRCECLFVCYNSTSHTSRLTCMLVRLWSPKVHVSVPVGGLVLTPLRRTRVGRRRLSTVAVSGVTSLRKCCDLRCTTIARPGESDFSWCSQHVFAEEDGPAVHCISSKTRLEHGTRQTQVARAPWPRNLHVVAQMPVQCLRTSLRAMTRSNCRRGGR